MRYILASLVLVFPFVTFAYGTAGFLEKPIWHTPETYFAGDTVRIYAALANSSDADVAGSLQFLVNEKSIGKRSFTMRSNEVTTVWYDWKATVGSHTFSAQVLDTSFSAQGSSTVVAPRVVAASPVIVATTSLPLVETTKSSTTTESLTLGETIDATADETREKLESVRTALEDTIATQRARVAGTSTVAEDASFAEAATEKIRDAATPPAVKTTQNIFAKIWLFVLNVAHAILSFFIGVLKSPFWTAIILVTLFMLIMKIIEKVFRIFSRRKD